MCASLLFLNRDTKCYGPSRSVMLSPILSLSASECPAGWRECPGRIHHVPYFHHLTVPVPHNCSVHYALLSLLNKSIYCFLNLLMIHHVFWVTDLQKTWNTVISLMLILFSAITMLLFQMRFHTTCFWCTISYENNPTWHIKEKKYSSQWQISQFCLIFVTSLNFLYIICVIRQGLALSTAGKWLI